MELPKVLVGCPTSDKKEYCLKEYLEGIDNLTYKNFELVLIDNSKEDSYFNKLKEKKVRVIKGPFLDSIKDTVINSRNILRKVAIDEGFDYLLMLEQDVIPPINIIEGLISYKRDVVSGVVYHLFPKEDKWEERPLIGIRSKNETGKFAFLRAEQISDLKALLEVDYCSMGCLLISKEILEKVEFRYEEYKDSNKENKEDVRWDDICFCEDVQRLGKKIFLDTVAKCNHLVIGGYSITLGDTTKMIQKNSINIKDIIEE